MRFTHVFAALVATSALVAGSVGAQAPAADPTTRLREVLPAEVAERVIARIAQARARQLPAAALEQRALKFASRGVSAADIEQSVAEHADRMARVQQTLEAARTRKPSGDEVDAGAEAMRRGVSGAEVSALAKSAPSGRSLAVPLYVVGGLMDRGLPADEALARVHERLQGRATDAELEALPAQVADRTPGRPAQTGRDLSATKRPGSAGRGAAGAAGTAGAPPAGVPAGRPAGVPAGGRPTGRP